MIPELSSFPGSLCLPATKAPQKRQHPWGRPGPGLPSEVSPPLVSSTSLVGSVAARVSVQPRCSRHSPRAFATSLKNPSLSPPGLGTRRRLCVESQLRWWLLGKQARLSGGPAVLVCAPWAFGSQSGVAKVFVFRHNSSHIFCLC